MDVQLFGAAMDASVTGIVITDNTQPDNPIIYCNKAFEQLSGYQQNEIIGHNCRFLQDEDRGQEARLLIKEAIRTGKHCKIEIRNYTKKGVPFWNELHISPVRNKNGTVINFIGIQNDVTRRKDAEHALLQERDNLETRVTERTIELKENEDYLASIVETIRESLIVLDENIKVLSVNEHFCKFFKCNENDLVGQQLYELLDGIWNIPALKDVLENILPHNNPFEDFEVAHEFPIIGKKLLVLNARQVTFKGKYQSRILLAMEDITERRKMEQRKEDFITVASHEMKTPLTSIKGHIQLLKRKAEKNQDEAYIMPLLTESKSIERLDILIKDLLDVAKIQSGKIQFNLIDFNFEDLVNDSISSVEGSTETHQIVVTGNTKVIIKADYSRLGQVMVNLLTNAIKYSPASKQVGVHVNVLANFLKVAISDTGVGIKREEHKNIFERFYRVEETQETFQGIGIGLYVCRQIIKEHHGTLWVESEPGQDSVFNFTIPIISNTK